MKQITVKRARRLHRKSGSDLPFREWVARRAAWRNLRSYDLHPKLHRIVTKRVLETERLDGIARALMVGFELGAL